MMINLFQIAAKANCGGLEPIVAIIKHGVLPIVWIGIPILLIIFGVVDLGKAVIASDDKEVKQAQSRLIKRVIYAIAIFFVTSIVSITMNLVAKGVTADNNSSNNGAESNVSTTNWASCWNNI